MDVYEIKDITTGSLKDDWWAKIGIMNVEDKYYDETNNQFYLHIVIKEHF